MQSWDPGTFENKDGNNLVQSGAAGGMVGARGLESGTSSKRRLRKPVRNLGDREGRLLGTCRPDGRFAKISHLALATEMGTSTDDARRTIAPKQILEERKMMYR